MVRAARPATLGRTAGARGGRPLRIALVHPYPWPEVRRGAERYLDDLSRHLAGAGHEVTVVTGGDGPARTERHHGGPTVRYRPHLRPPGAARLGLGEVETFGGRALWPVLHDRPDVVHALTPSTALAGRLAGRPTLYTVLGHPDRSQLPVGRAPRALFREAVRRSTLTATLSGASAQALSASTGRPAVVLPAGVDLDRFTPDLAPRRGPLVLLFSASLADSRKRARLAVAALAVLLTRHPEARLRLSGQGDPAAVVAAAAELGERVAAAVDPLGPGHPGEVAGRYRSATVTVLPAAHEALGLALLESLACGTPVACTPDGGMPEIVGEDPVGLVATAATPAALARAVEGAAALAARPATPRRCVERARRWDWRRTIGPAHEHLYSLLAEGRSAEAVAAPGRWRR